MIICQFENKNKNKNINQNTENLLKNYKNLKKQSMSENYSEKNPENNFSMKDENSPESRMNELYFKKFKYDDNSFKNLQTVTNTRIFILFR